MTINRGNMRRQIERPPMKKTTKKPAKKMMRGGMAGAAGRIPPQAAPGMARAQEAGARIPMMKKGGKVRSGKK